MPVEQYLKGHSHKIRDHQIHHPPNTFDRSWEIKQFWETASASTFENGDMEITATIDGKVKVVFEASIRRHLKLEDYDGIST
ncbi:hypothetical protein Tco_0670587, partial [Tanacetum coccineum]